MIMNLKKLEVAVRKATQDLETYRAKRLERLRERIGKHYSDEGTKTRTPLNLLAMAAGIHLRHLAGGQPRVMVNVTNAELKPAADDLERAGNVLLKEIDFLKTLRNCVVDGWFGCGILKIGLNYSGQIEVGGFLHDVGQPFCDNVSLDDFVYDVTAKRWDQIAFVGNFYRMPLEDALKSGLFNENAKKLTPKEKSDLNEISGDEKAQSLGGFETSYQEEYVDHVELLDLWLPRENRFITIGVADNWVLLRDVEWQGPESGPYHILYLDEVSDNIMPMPPSAAWLDLHRLANALLNKIGDQASRQKSLGVFPRGAGDDADTLKNADDGEVVELDSPDKAKEVRFGGPDQVLMALFIQIKDLFSWSANNLDTLGGLGAMADTATQENLLSQNSSKAIEDMKDRVISFVKKVIHDLLWYLWYDPLIKIPIVKRVPGVDVDIPAVFSSDVLEGDFLDYNFDIDPYSLQYRTPQGQLQKIMTFTQQLILPLLPLMEAQGMTMQLSELVSIIAEYSDTPELKNIISFLEEQQQQAAQQRIVGEPGKPPVTSRSYNRISQSTGGTRTGRDQAMFQQLMGNKQMSANPSSQG